MATLSAPKGIVAVTSNNTYFLEKFISLINVPEEITITVKRKFITFSLIFVGYQVLKLLFLLYKIQRDTVMRRK